MAAYYVNSAAGGTNTGGSWTNAFLTLLQATAVATNADIIYVDDGHNEGGTAALTITLPATPGLRILSVDSALGLTPTAVSAGAVVAIATGSVALGISGCAYVYGVLFKSSATSSSSAIINIGVTTTSPTILTIEDGSLEVRTTTGSSFMNIGNSASTSADEHVLTLINSTIGTGNAAAGGTIKVRGIRLRFSGVSLIGQPMTSIFTIDPGVGPDIEIVDSDMTGVTVTNLVSAPASSGMANVRFIQCKLPSGYVALTTTAVVQGTEVSILDCASGDTHGLIEYHNALGNIVTESTIKFTGGAASQSWKITTTAYASFTSPFCTPWVNWYNTGTSAITPRIEVVRTGSATALNNDDLWIEVDAKVTSGSTQATRTTDRRGLLAANAAQDTGAGTWDGSPGTPWYGKLEVASLTPAENGHIRGRVCVGLASVAGTVYADPQIRT